MRCHTGERPYQVSNSFIPDIKVFIGVNGLFQFCNGVGIVASEIRTLILGIKPMQLS